MILNAYLSRKVVEQICMIEIMYQMVFGMATNNVSLWHHHQSNQHVSIQAHQLQKFHFVVYYNVL